MGLEQIRRANATAELALKCYIYLKIKYNPFASGNGKWLDIHTSNSNQINTRISDIIRYDIQWNTPNQMTSRVFRLFIFMKVTLLDTVLDYTTLVILECEYPIFRSNSNPFAFVYTRFFGLKGKTATLFLRLRILWPNVELDSVLATRFVAAVYINLNIIIITLFYGRPQTKCITNTQYVRLGCIAISICLCSEIYAICRVEGNWSW